MRLTTLNRKIEGSSGRYFGLTTKDGRTYNAKLVGSTPKFFVIYDRNKELNVKLSKKNIASVRGL